MKSLILVFIALNSLVALAQMPKALFTQKEQQEILNEVGNLEWGDDFGYDFTRIYCVVAGSEHRCEINATLKQIIYLAGVENEYEPQIFRQHNVLCDISGLKKKSDVIESRHGQNKTIAFAQAFTDKLGLCLSAIQEHIESGK